MDEEDCMTTLAVEEIIIDSVVLLGTSIVENHSGEKIETEVYQFSTVLEFVRGDQVKCDKVFVVKNLSTGDWGVPLNSADLLICKIREAGIHHRSLDGVWRQLSALVSKSVDEGNFTEA